MKDAITNKAMTATQALRDAVVPVLQLVGRPRLMDRAYTTYPK
ncbi:hypothetical protein OJ996_25485 [Luteolibacter sp. GHJ8]|uniref:Uncharacterized protein n=1 Tax=Luteolibacter rhizosphaerae TaxID=2989719 RepID=A0ABT3GBE4_9BACT|nr:hypothetical protein [Luteolibacter rhizosphaerae]MCW1916967.1 hypothetical protein [Luteolibacter rhizosphaerae]